ncbi:DUF1028 domain-containing protein [Segnochrobactrum spirostomi]|uniref:DUF1028 domain-containing protein n=1 Tax=Segnochrobactrum spirostomi TaxID=2608987 RepID=A0A6A7Y9Z6_9HYPH|nr:DUF1028 domain-containing protein [Segnochrobactrum spirostomi]MQT14838.1 DUF1028 domain-containing protein [Segnochrobactrum spirostomi]
MTFSIAARCERTGRFGIAIASSSPAVAARCAHARAGVGVVASQNVTDPALGQRGLDLLAEGLDAAAVLERLVASTPYSAWRQLAIVDGSGRTAAFSGARALGLHATAEGRNAVAAGNLLAAKTVPATMVRAFEAADGLLAERLLQAMAAAVEAGGEAGPIHSAGLLVVDKVSWPVVDLRVDWHEGDPVGALAALYALFAPQADAYVTRALNPETAPSFGVAGDP